MAENCANCGRSTNGERLCRACINHRMCRRCRRYLPTHRYDGDDETTCRTCRNIRPENLHRYALQNTAAQHSWNGNDNEIDVAEFLRQRADEIASIYSSAIDEHRSIKYFFRLEVEFSCDVSDDDDTTTVQRTTGLFATSPTTSATDPTIDFETLISTFENAIAGFTSLGSTGLSIKYRVSRCTSARIQDIQIDKSRLENCDDKKIGLSPYDMKRYILPDGISTLAYGHYKIAGCCE